MARLIFGRIWLVWAGLWFVLIFLALYPLFLIWLSHPSLYRIAHFQRRIWGIATCIPALLIPVISYETRLPKNRQRIYCANHSSYLDILTTGTYLPAFNFFMAKMELSKVPLFRIWFRTIDVPVQREKMRSSHRAFVSAGEKYDKGASMIIFPEGKIPVHTPQMNSLKNGAFKLAIEKGALVIPVTLPSNYKRLDVHKWFATPGIMRMHVHRPIDTAGLNPEDAETLKEQVFHILENKLKAFGTIKETHEDKQRKSG